MPVERKRGTKRLLDACDVGFKWVRGNVRRKSGGRGKGGEGGREARSLMKVQQPKPPIGVSAVYPTKELAEN